MSEYRRKQAYDAGRKAALGGKPRSSCKRQQGTIFYDDWHDGYDHGQREQAASEGEYGRGIEDAAKVVEKIGQCANTRGLDGHLEAFAEDIAGDIRALATLPKPEQPPVEASEQGEVTRGDLADRLDEASSRRVYSGLPAQSLMQEAATAIRTLEDEVARLRLTNQHLMADTRAYWRDRATAAEAKLAEATEVVQQIRDYTSEHGGAAKALKLINNFLSPKEPS